MHALWQAGVANNYEPNLRLKFSFAITIYFTCNIIRLLEILFKKYICIDKVCNKRRTVKVIE